MLFDGLSRKLAEKMCRIELDIVSHDLNQKTSEKSLQKYYEDNAYAMKKCVFNDSFNSFHFWKLLSDIIKKSHKNLPFILRNQYTNSHQVYEHMYNSYHSKDMVGHKSISRIVLSAPCNIMTQYRKQVYQFIVLPTLYRHHIYSPLMALTIFINLMYHMADFYIQKNLESEGKKTMSEYMKRPFTKTEINQIEWLSDHEKKILCDELDVHMLLLQ